MASNSNPESRASKEGAPRYTAQEWEAQRINIERLYVKEDRPLKEVIQSLSQEFGFVARYNSSTLSKSRL